MKKTLLSLAIFTSTITFANTNENTLYRKGFNEKQKSLIYDACTVTKTESVTRQFPDCDGGVITLTATASCTVTASSCSEASLSAQTCAAAKAGKAIIPPPPCPPED